jgi:hypothetical protein
VPSPSLRVPCMLYHENLVPSRKLWRLIVAELKHLSINRIPWQYYSATCRDTYSLPDTTSIVQPRDAKKKLVSHICLLKIKF